MPFPDGKRQTVLHACMQLSRLVPIATPVGFLAEAEGLDVLGRTSTVASTLGANGAIQWPSTESDHTLASITIPALSTMLLRVFTADLHTEQYCSL